MGTSDYEHQVDRGQEGTGSRRSVAQQLRFELRRSLTFPGFTSRRGGDPRQRCFVGVQVTQTSRQIFAQPALLPGFSVTRAIAASIFTLLHLRRQQKEAQRRNFKGKSIKRQCMCPE